MHGPGNVGRTTFVRTAGQEPDTSKPGAAVTQVPDPRATPPQFGGGGGGPANGRGGELLRTRHTASERRNHARSGICAPSPHPGSAAPLRPRTCGLARAWTRGRRRVPAAAAKCTIRRDPPPASLQGPIGAPNAAWQAGKRPGDWGSGGTPVGRGCPGPDPCPGGQNPPNPCKRLRSAQVVASLHQVSTRGLNLACLWPAWGPFRESFPGHGPTPGGSALRAVRGQP